jgi:hypothetical protein
MLDAAAAGRVDERVSSLDDSTKRLTTVARSEDGLSWVTEITAESYAANSETFLVVGPLWDRLQRGDHGYEAWDPSSLEPTS